MRVFFFFFLVPNYLPVSQPQDEPEFMSPQRHQKGKGRDRGEGEIMQGVGGFFFVFFFPLQSVSSVESCRSVSGSGSPSRKYDTLFPALVC